MTEIEDKSEIILAESGPVRADRQPETFHVGQCSECGAEIHFFRSERHVCCLYCGAWTKKPVNGKAMTI